MARPRKRDELNRIDVEVGMRLRTIRVRRGITQMELAAAIGLTFQQIQKYEMGRNSIASARLPALCKALDITPNNLFGDDDVPTGEPLPQLSSLAIRTAQRFDELPMRLRNTVSGLLKDLNGRAA